MVILPEIALLHYFLNIRLLFKGEKTHNSQSSQNKDAFSLQVGIGNADSLRMSMDFRHFPGCEVSQNPTDKLAMIRVGVFSILYLMGGIDGKGVL